MPDEIITITVSKWHEVINRLHEIKADAWQNQKIKITRREITSVSTTGLGKVEAKVRFTFEWHTDAMGVKLLAE